MKKVSILIPVFNEEDNVNQIYRAVKENIPANYSADFIFIDDGSADNTLTVIKELANSTSDVSFISLTRNFGHQAALMAGLQMADGDVIITMDADFQDPPEKLSQFFEVYESGKKIVYGKRVNRSNDSFIKRLTAKWYYKLQKISSGYDILENVADFRLMDKDVVANLLKMNEKSIYLRGMISWLGFPYGVVEYERPHRKSGETKYSLIKMINLAMNGILSFSLLPLKIGFFIGIASMGLGTSFLTYITYDALINNEVYPLFKWLVVILFIFVGFLFTLLWILSEYIGKIYYENLNRPIFVVNETSVDQKRIAQS